MSVPEKIKYGRTGFSYLLPLPAQATFMEGKLSVPPQSSPYLASNAAHVSDFPPVPLLLLLFTWTASSSSLWTLTRGRLQSSALVFSSLSVLISVTIWSPGFKYHLDANDSQKSVYIPCIPDMPSWILPWISHRNLKFQMLQIQFSTFPLSPPFLVLTYSSHLDKRQIHCPVFLGSKT